MARIFISHSSRDNFEALAFKQWLTTEGWTPDDVFLDLHGIGAGERWKEALKKANERCEAVILLLSPHSLSSNECYVEIRMAEDYGKVILPTILPARIPEDILTIDDPRLAIHRDRQIVDVSTDPRSAVFTVEHDGQRKAVTFHRPTLDRIRARLGQLGISPTSFMWNPGNLDTASPYPGLEGFTQGEAALFFGRSGDIARGFTELRKLRRAGSGQILVVQAASGAGKSSFLRAGLWPRIARDPDFVAVGILRPATGIIAGENGLCRQFAAFFSDRGIRRTAADIQRPLLGQDEAARAALAALLNEMTEIGHATQRVANPSAPPPTPVIAVDQAEELFAATDAHENRRFLSLVSSLLSLDLGKRSGAAQQSLIVPPLFVWTIRADSVDTLLHVTEEAGLKPPVPFLLPPIPRDAYREIIEDPAAVANQAGMRITVDPLLVNELVTKSTGGDALPLLAYALRQILADNRSGASAALTLEQYEVAGGIGGILSKRLEVAQRSASARQEDLRRLFIPRLATWDSEASPPGAKRLVADESQLFAGERTRLKTLADALVEERLLTRGQLSESTHGSTLEVAHEALLRQPPLSSWLEEDSEFLSWRENVERARQLNEVNVGATVFGVEISQVERWLIDRAADLTPSTREFARRAIDDASIRHEKELQEARLEQQRQQAELEATRAREESARERAASSRRVARRTMTGMLVALVFAFGAAAAGWYADSQRQLAVRQTDLATAAVARARDEADKALEAEQRAKTEAANARAAEAKANDAELRASMERDVARITQSGLLSDVASQRANAKESSYVPALLLALHGLPDQTRDLRGVVLDDRPHVANSEHSLYEAVAGLRERYLLAGHTGSVESAAFAMDGARIVTASEDGTARIWDAVTGRTLGILRGHEGPLVSAAFSPEGARIVTASADGTARVWEASNGQLLFKLSGHTDSVANAAFSPDGEHVVTTSADQTARVWEVATGRAMALLEGHTASLSGFAFSPDGARIVTASRDRSARIWNAITGQELSVLRGHDGWLLSVAFSADGTRIVTASEDKTARIWDAATGNVLVALTGHEGAVSSAVFSSDGGQIVTTSSDTTVRIWNANTGTELATLRGHNDWVLSAAISPDGKTIASASSDNTARLWDAATGSQVAILAGHSDGVVSITFSPDGARIITSSLDHTARVWNLATDNLMTTLAGHTNSVTSVAFSPLDGTQVLSASGDRTARLWDAATGKLIATYAGHNGAVSSAAFSPDGTRILTASEDKTARIWDTVTGSAILMITGHEGAVTSAVFSPDGKQVLTIASGNEARLWSTTTGNQIATLPGHDDWVLSVAFKSGSVRIITASAGNDARLRDATSGGVLATFAGHTASVDNGAFSPDGDSIVTTSRDKSARLWDVTTGRALATLMGHNNWVLSAAFSPNATRIVTTSADGTARIWDVGSGNRLATIAGHDGPVGSAAFGPNGTQIVTAGVDKTARIWRIFPTTQALVDHAKHIVPRCLSQAQLKQFFLPLEPLRWCITGAGLEAEPASSKWQPKWPYQGERWRDWLIARDRGEKPDLPKD